MAIEIGNLDTTNKEHPERAGWFLGSFIPENSLLHAENCEAKWVRHERGLRKASAMESDRSVRTVVVLISGKWQIDFNSGRQVLMEKPGDFVVFDNEAHVSEAPEDCLVFVVRWYPNN